MKSVRLPIFAVFVAAFSILPLLLAWPGTLSLDWDYFNALSLLIRSQFLQYHVFPIHDPWMSGGLDLLTNGQTRLFSPLLFLNVVLDPVMANLATLFLYALGGVAGCILIARFYRWHLTSTILLSTGFIWSSWFSLHFSEGHLPFAAFQLLPLLQYFILVQAKNARARFGIGLLFTLLFAEGQIYPFFFLGFYLLFWILASRRLSEWFARPREWILSFLSIALMVFARLLPTLANPIKRPLLLDQYTFSFVDLQNIFFNPNQSLLVKLSEESEWRFHEFGCYLGVFWAILFCTTIFIFVKKKEIRSSPALPYLFLAGWWFWIASGWGERFNPWTLFQAIPAVNRLHIQSRTLILFVFPFFMVCLFGWEKLRVKLPLRWQILLVIVLGSESALVHSGTMIETLKKMGKDGPGSALITSTTLTKTLPIGMKFEHYLNDTDNGCVMTYEPSAPDTTVQSFDSKNYRGEIYSDHPAKILKIGSYTPGKVSFDYDLASPEPITLNTNFLMGWQASDDSAGEVVSSEGGLLQFKPKNAKGTIELSYHPRYLGWSVCLALMSWLSVITAWIISRRGKHV